MKNYTEGITEEIMISNDIDGLQIMQEIGKDKLIKIKPRIIIKYNTECYIKEIIIDSDEDMIQFIEKLKQK